MARSTTSTPASAALKHRGRRDAAGVVRVEMHRDADLLLERLHQRVRRGGPAKPGHVLDGQEMRAHFFQFPRQLDDNTSANIWRAPGPGYCRCNRSRLRKPRASPAPPPWPPSGSAGSSANRRCGKYPCPPPPRASRNRPRRCPDNWNSPPRSSRGRAFGNRCSESARAAARSRCHGSSCRKRSAVSNVAPPHISRLNKLRRAARDGVRHRQHVVRAQPRGEQRLVRVAQGRVRDEQLLLLERPFGEFFRPEFEQQLPRARRRRLFAVAGRRAARQARVSSG